MGAAMTGLRPIAEIMFSDFFAVCWDLIANEIAKSRYMSDGQLELPLVVRCANGAGLRFGAQHSQSVENWAMAVPGLKVVAPSNPRDVMGLLAASVRDPDPVLFFEHKGLYATKGDVPEGVEIVDELGRASVLRQGADATILALAAMVPKSMAAAERLSAEDGIETTVIDVRSLVPLDTRTILAEVEKTGRLFTVEENPRLCGWGAEIVSIVAEEAFGALTGPVIRITTPHIPLPAADKLEDHVLPSVDRITETIRKALLAGGTTPKTVLSSDWMPFIMTSQFICTSPDIAHGRVYWLRPVAPRGSPVIAAPTGRGYRRPGRTIADLHHHGLEPQPPRRPGHPSISQARQHSLTPPRPLPVRWRWARRHRSRYRLPTIALRRSVHWPNDQWSPDRRCAARL
jgi:pyruvate dehydrogenase E1 component beta subunit